MNQIQRIVWLEKYAQKCCTKAAMTATFGRYNAGAGFGTMWFSDKKKAYDHKMRRAAQAVVLSKRLQHRLARELGRSD